MVSTIINLVSWNTWQTHVTVSQLVELSFVETSTNSRWVGGPEWLMRNANGYRALMPLVGKLSARKRGMALCWRNPPHAI